jgi:hypothetical protein
MNRKEKEIRWELPKKRQPVWRVFKWIFRPIFFVKNVEFLFFVFFECA